MSPVLRSLLNARLASERFPGADAPSLIYALTLIAGDPETPIMLATEATRECGRIMFAECQGFVLSKPDGSNLPRDVHHLPRAKAALVARSIASSTVMFAARQSRGDV